MDSDHFIHIFNVQVRPTGFCESECCSVPLTTETVFDNVIEPNRPLNFVEIVRIGVNEIVEELPADQNPVESLYERPVCIFKLRGRNW